MKNLFTVNSVAIASSLEATAKELAAAAAAYQRMPSFRRDLAAGLSSLRDRLNDEWAVFLTKVNEEASSAPQK